jgi:hypothetical protein
MWTALFWKATAERALKTFAQSFVATIGIGATDLLNIGWQQALSVAGLATLISVLTSLASAKLSGDPESPSLVAGEK